MTTLTQYRAMLPVNKHRLDTELETQADTMDRISSEVTTCNSDMLQAKDDLARVEARLLEEARDTEAKITIDQAQAIVKRHPERARAWKAFQQARADYEEWHALLEAWRARGFSIKTLADLWLGQYYTTDSHTVSDRQRRRDREPDERSRADIRQASSRTSERRPLL